METTAYVWGCGQPSLPLFRDGGVATEATDARGLAEIGRRLDELEKSRIESFQYTHYRETYPWLGLAALAVLAVTIFLEETHYRRLP